VGKWNDYAKANSLPHSQTFIQRFGSWNNIKERLNLELNSQHRPQKYEQNELMVILNEHKGAYKSINAWNQYASKHKLPTHQVFEKYLGLDVIEEITGLQTELSKDFLKNHIKEHFPNRPPTITEWNNIAKEKSVVSSSTIVRRFGSWNNMKAHVYFL